MVRFSCGLQPAYPFDETLELISTLDRLGFHACYTADDPSARDPWVVLATAATATTRIRLGPGATHVFLRDPTFIAQALATLDELSHGRTEAVVSFGDPSMLDAYHVEWRDARPLRRVREAIDVMRAYLDHGQVDHDGEFFRYSGLSTIARPVQQRLPLLVGAMGGPRSFQLAGQVGDGVQSVGCSRENSEFVVAQVAEGARRAGRDWRQLDIAAAFVAAVSHDGEAAKEAARIIAATWLTSLPKKLAERHGMDHEQVDRIGAALAAGDVAQAVALTTPEIAEAFTVAGTPEECAEKIRTRLVEPGITHLVLAVADPPLVEAYGGGRLDGVPDLRDQVQLIHDRVFPAFSDA
jgi:5,10-methylenetetrahydromethanopterin reductase